MNVQTTYQRDIAVIRVEGRVDSSNVREFEQHALGEIDSGSRKLILDFSGCPFLSSAGIRVILICAKKLNFMSGRLVITGLNNYLKQVFQITGLPSILNIQANIEEGIESMESAVEHSGEGPAEV